MYFVPKKEECAYVSFELCGIYRCVHFVLKYNLLIWKMPKVVSAADEK
jgi:hypothetical protein